MAYRVDTGGYLKEGGNPSGRGRHRRAKPLLVFIAFAALAAATGAGAEEGSDAVPTIVNGIRTQGWPSTGALLYDFAGYDSSICTGTLVGCQNFLTAAHCLVNEDGSQTSASDLAVYLQHAGIFNVTGYHVHPGYDPADLSSPHDVAVLDLAANVDGVSPSRLNNFSPAAFIPHSADIVGFGLADSGSSGWTTGIKRYGRVVTAACDTSEGLSDTTHVCWNFRPPYGPPGQYSTVCQGDSGGPSFMDLGSGYSVAGVTSGYVGWQGLCDVNTHNYNTNVWFDRLWILSHIGDLGGSGCGPLAEVEGPLGTAVFAADGELDEWNAADSYTIDLPAGVRELRVVLNGKDWPTSRNFDLYVNRGSEASPSNFVCAGESDDQYEACNLLFPQSGTWYLKVKREGGDARYQLTAAQFGLPAVGQEVPAVGLYVRIRDYDAWRRTIAWQAKDRDIIVPPAPGSADDPRCVSDGGAGAPASIRFFSDRSGGSVQDTGELALPCEYWSQRGTTSRPYFKYYNRTYYDSPSPCYMVYVMSGKLRASCSYRYSEQPLAYDLIPGIDEGHVVTLLKIGSRTFCTAFDDNGRSNGSDGERFVGDRYFPRPLSCASVAP